MNRRTFFSAAAQFVAGCAIALNLRSEPIVLPQPEEDRNAPNPDFITVPYAMFFYQDGSEEFLYHNIPANSEVPVVLKRYDKRDIDRVWRGAA